jgi:hypothetical protein
MKRFALVNCHIVVLIDKILHRFYGEVFFLLLRRQYVIRKVRFLTEGWGFGSFDRKAIHKMDWFSQITSIKWEKMEITFYFTFADKFFFRNLPIYISIYLVKFTPKSTLEFICGRWVDPTGTNDIHLRLKKFISDRWNSSMWDDWNHAFLLKTPVLSALSFF